MTTVLVTGASGDTGRPTVERLLEKGFHVRALVRQDDHRAQRLRDLGAEVVFGDMKSLRDIRLAMNGVQRAYFVFPLAEGLVDRYYWIQSPVWLGDDGIPAVEGIPGSRLMEAERWQVVERRALGEDTLLVVDRAGCLPES